MKNLSQTLALSMLISLNATALDDCPLVDSSISEVLILADDSNEITAAMTETQKVLGLTVTKFGINQGRGKVSVLTNDDGSLAGLRVDFDLKGKKSVLLKTFDELQNNEKLEYFENVKSNSAALVVKKASSSDISAKNGGKFQFSVLSKKPDTYKHFNLFLRKVGNAWVVKNENGVIQKSVDITPNVSNMDWNGTFSSVNFE